jgi:hypothetical protein
MAKTLRQSDSAAEIEIGKFLDKFFYVDHVTNFSRYNDINQQMSGVDVKFDYRNQTNMLVDEKAAAHYVNKDIPTFAFEINFLLNSGQLVDGWFYDGNKLTQYYLLGWIWAKKDKGFTMDDITKLDIMIINRLSIIEYLSQNGLTRENANRISNEIRKKGDFGAYEKSSDKSYYFFYSPQLSEKPVNIIIKKNALLNLSIGRHAITR